MASLPPHGRIHCAQCFKCKTPVFDSTRETSPSNDWRITNNPLAWGGTAPEVVVLGFSKGPTQAGALANTSHEQIAYKGGRTNVAKIFGHVGLLPANQATSEAVGRLISAPNGRFHFGSLIRCTVERKDGDRWLGTGAGMLDNFIATEFGRTIAGNCAKTFLGELPASTKLVVMFGTGSKLSYVKAVRELFMAARPGSWRTINDVAYADDQITVVHVEHFASQGAHLPNWLGRNDHKRKELGIMARTAVQAALA